MGGPTKLNGGYGGSNNYGSGARGNSFSAGGGGD